MQTNAEKTECIMRCINTPLALDSQGSRAHLSPSAPKKKKYQLVNKGRETSGHIHDTKHLTRSLCKGQFTTAANTAVKLQRRVAADSKQQLACPTGPNEH